MAQKQGLRDGVPRLLPDGYYRFKITDVIEAPSTYPGQTSYWRIFFIVKNKDNEHYNFALVFTPKMDRYHEVMLAVGGRRDEKGFVRVPDDVMGCEFIGRIYIRKALNDKRREVNDIDNIRALKPTEVAEIKETVDTELAEYDKEIEDGIPEGLKTPVKKEEED